MDEKKIGGRLSWALISESSLEVALKGMKPLQAFEM